MAWPDLPARQRADLTIELSRTFVEHALSFPSSSLGTSPDGRGRLWREAELATGVFLQRQLTNPRRLVVQLADALVPLARGETARQEAEMLDPFVAPATAVADLRSAMDKLSILARDVATALRQRHKTTSRSGDELSAVELQSLARHIEFHIAQAAINTALCYPSASTDRADALGQALARLDSLATSTSGDEIIWQARLDRVRCLRWLRRLDTAASEAASLAKQAIPATLRLPLVTEQARAALTQGKFDDAIQALDAAGAPLAQSVQPAVRADADLARLEILLAMWRKSYDAGQQDAAVSKQRQASALVREIASKHSPYWTRRAKLALASVLARVPDLNDVTVLSAVAEHHWHARRWSEALAAYDRAIEQARKSQPPDDAFKLALAAASIEESHGQPSRAIQRYRQAALAAPKHADAQRAHLQAVWLTAKHVGPKSDQYGQLLKEHLANWPAGSTSKDATLWLNRWNESRRDPLAEAAALAAAGNRTEALVAYKTLAASQPDNAELQRAYGRLLLSGDDQLPAALDQWRLIERKTRPGTPDWFKAKYSIALAHERSGDKTQAARVVTLLATLYTDLGGPEQAAKFRALLARCQRL